MIYGAQLVDIILPVSGIFWNSKLDEKWLSYGQKTYAHIWAYGPNLLIYGPYIGQVTLFFNENKFIR